jgi:hypothetical protein
MVVEVAGLSTVVAHQFWLLLGDGQSPTSLQVDQTGKQPVCLVCPEIRHSVYQSPTTLLTLLACSCCCVPQNLKDAASWLGYTYLYVRMLGSPQLYGVPLGALEDDLELEQHRLDLAHSAAVLLDKHNLIRYVLRQQ